MVETQPRGTCVQPVPIARGSLPPKGPVPLNMLWQQVTEIPFFRALLRAFEAHFFRQLDLPKPLLDLGCGDGHFAAHAYAEYRPVGLDPWWSVLQEAKGWTVYSGLVCADGAAMPFPNAFFASVVSNSVLEHIPHLEDVLRETARVLRPGGWLVFSVPNHRFEDYLALAHMWERIGLSSLARAYRAWFQRISRHIHCDPPEVWIPRLEQAGFRVVQWWHYFPPEALRALEWGHYLGLPSLVSKKLTGRWLLTSARWNVAPVVAWLRRFLGESAHPQGAYTFYIARKPSIGETAQDTNTGPP